MAPNLNKELSHVKCTWFSFRKFQSNRSKLNRTVIPGHTETGLKIDEDFINSLTISSSSLYVTLQYIIESSTSKCRGHAWPVFACLIITFKLASCQQNDFILSLLHQDNSTYTNYNQWMKNSKNEDQNYYYNIIIIINYPWMVDRNHKDFGWAKTNKDI